MDRLADYHTKWHVWLIDKHKYDITNKYNLTKWYKWTYLQNRNRSVCLDIDLWLEGERVGGKG